MVRSFHRKHKWKCNMSSYWRYTCVQREIMDKINLGTKLYNKIRVRGGDRK